MQGWGGEGDKQVTDAVRTTTESRRNTESERMTGDEILYNLQMIKEQVLNYILINKDLMKSSSANPL